MCLAEHIMIIWDRYVGRILDTRFEVTRTKLNFALVDTNMELDSYDIQMVAPFSFDKDIHDKIGTNGCKFAEVKEMSLFKEGEKSPTGQEDREIIKTR